ncbi:MAG TPA: S8 family serine peptidase, partial [Bacteroidales bacterium]|nr:S8 family serine peptidase [Bacteroidales bacterium]
MKKIILLSAAAALFMTGACDKAVYETPMADQQSFVQTINDDIIPGQYIVFLKEGVTSIKAARLSYSDARIRMKSEMIKVLASADISPREPLQVYAAGTEGFAVKLSDEEAGSLRKNESVLGVWPDRMFILKRPAPVPSPQPAQTTPAGITRVGGVTGYTGGKKAWIIDTGIDLNHPDLNVDAASGKTFVTRTTTPEDDNGHGTHCAGIVGALNNTIGVVGVAPGAAVVPVKVLDKRGSGAYSVIIAGIDWVIAKGNAGDAVNMSLGGGVYEPIDLKVIEMSNKGLFVALAAGNESDYASNHSPARANGENIFTISACNSDDLWASFSNYGNPPVDFCAPGVSIVSTYKGDTYASMSG